MMIPNVSNDTPEFIKQAQHVVFVISQLIDAGEDLTDESSMSPP